MSFLLDTNACIAVMNGRPAAVRARLEREFRRSAAIGVPSVALYELWCGVAESARAEANRKRLDDFLGSGLGVIEFDRDDARVAGQIRAALEQSGRTIGPYDVLIAGQSLARDLILVTSNRREFGRVKGLRWEDWARP